MDFRSIDATDKSLPPHEAPKPTQLLRRVDQSLSKLAIEFLVNELITSRSREANVDFSQKWVCLPESVRIKIGQGLFSGEKYARWQAAAESFVAFTHSPTITPSDFKAEQIHQRLEVRMSQLGTHFSTQDLEELLLLAVMLHYSYKWKRSQELTEDCRKSLPSHTTEEDLDCLSVLFEEFFKLKKAYECLYCAHVKDMLKGDDFRTKMNLAIIYHKMYSSCSNNKPLDEVCIRDWREKARMYAKQANELNPTDLKAINLYASICADEGCFPEAIKYYHMFISREEGNVSVWISLLRIYQILDHLPDNYEKAMHCCDKLLALGEPESRVFYAHKKSELQIGLMMLKDVKEAEKLLNQKLTEYPQSLVYNFLKHTLQLKKVKTLCDQRLRTKELALIEKELAKLTSQGGIFLNASHLKAKMMILRGNLEMALTYYRESLKNGVGIWKDLFSINRISLIMEYCDTFFSAEWEPLSELIPLLFQVVRMAPDYYDAWFLKAQVEGKVGFRSTTFQVKQQYCLSSIKSYLRCIELRGHHFHSFSQIAGLYLHIAEKGEAVRYARLTFEERKRMHKISLTSDPKLIELLLACDLVPEAVECYQFGLCYQATEASMAIKLQILQAQNQIEQALQEGLLYLRKHPTSVVINTDVAFLFYLQGNHEESLKFSGVAIDLNPHLPYPCYVKALAYQSIGKYPLAIHYFHKSLENGAKDNLEISGRLFECLVATHKMDSALELFKKVHKEAPKEIS